MKNKNDIRFISKDEIIEAVQPSRILEISKAYEIQDNFKNLDRVIINDSKTSNFSKLSKKKSD